MEIKVSVIVPVYNTKQYLEKCVESIINQTYKNLEIILVDDGSNDGSSDICDELAARDDRIRVIHKENGGAASARNLGLDEADGSYLMFIDADDWIDGETVQTLVERICETSADVVRFNYVREFPDKQLSKKNTFLKEGLVTDGECRKVRRQILGLVGEELAHPENMNFLASCGFNIYNKSVVLESGARFVPLSETGSFNDGLFNFTVFGSVKSFDFIDRPFYHYRKTNSGAATANYRKNYLSRQLVLFDKLESELNKSEDSKYFHQAFNNRIVFSSMEGALNAMRNKAGFRARYREIKAFLKNERFKAAYRTFSLKTLGLKWKIYFFFIKHSMPLFAYAMTKMILKLKNRGTK